MSVMDAHLDRLADQLLGLSGAEVAYVIRDARARARVAERELTIVDIQEAADCVQPSLDPELFWRMCVHEAGHLIAGHAMGLPPATSVRVTARGGEVLRPHLSTVTEQTVRDLISTVLAGRVAEALVYGDISAGGGGRADSDLAQATVLAVQFETAFGFGKTLAWISADTPVPLLPEPIQLRIEAALQAAHETAHAILKDQGELLDRVAAALHERRELNAVDVAVLLTDEAVPPKNTGREI